MMVFRGFREKWIRGVLSLVKGGQSPLESMMKTILISSWERA
jgi:hypothetical protein